MSNTAKQIEECLQMLQDMSVYPLSTRIAAKLIADGWSEESFHACFLNKIKPARTNSQVNQVYNAMRDLSRAGIPPRLATLAAQLGTGNENN